MCYNIIMLISNDDLLGEKVLSLHTGGPIAEIDKIIIDPHSLKVIAFELTGNLIGGQHGTILETSSVREFSRLGLIIDSIDELVFPGDIIKLDEIMSLHFDLIDLKVESKKGTKLGRVKNYTIGREDFLIYQLIVKRPAIKALVDPELTIHRSLISEVNDEKIIIKEEEDKIRRDSVNEFIPNFINPFREPQFSPTQSQTPDEQDN